jgi:hypothetical protein
MNPSNPAAMAWRTSVALSSAAQSPVRFFAGMGRGRSRSCPPVRTSAAGLLGASGSHRLVYQSSVLLTAKGNV